MTSRSCRDGFLLVSLVVGCVAIHACKEASGVAAPEKGEWNIHVVIHPYDEFLRPDSLAVPVSLVLQGKDRVLHALVPAGTTTYVFEELPIQKYILNASASGYFPSQSNSYSYNGQITIDAYLHSLPSLLSRIDSIQCNVRTEIPRVFVRILAAQTLPAGGSRWFDVYFCSKQTVSPRYGDFEYLMQVSQTPGTSEITTEDLYRELHATGFQKGTTVYVTARIEIPGGEDTNSIVVSSFVMP